VWHVLICSWHRAQSTASSTGGGYNGIFPQQVLPESLIESSERLTPLPQKVHGKGTSLCGQRVHVPSATVLCVIGLLQQSRHDAVQQLCAQHPPTLCSKKL
jgi:hypothetical protein